MPELIPYSSAWWLDRLCTELDRRATFYSRLGSYYDGRQPLAFGSKKFNEAFAKLFVGFGDNFCRLVVQATEERLTVEGFRIGDPAGDKKAWRIWQANQMDNQSQKAHREALIKSECSIIVWPGPAGGTPLIRVQKPEEVIVAYADDPLERAVALKRWQAPDGRRLATLYYADSLEKYEARAGTSPIVWQPRRVAGEPWPLPHDLGVVPVVPLVNDPDLDNAGTSEIESVIPLQDALNKELVDMLVASEYGAFRQRWATGLEIPVDPETGKALEPFKVAIDRIWATAAPDAKFGEFGQTDLGPYVKAIETLIQHIASTTRTPPHYLLGQAGSFPSGESLKATETGLVAKALRRQRDFGEAWEEVIRIAFRAAGDSKRAGAIDSETIWRDPESRTESEHVDALVKMGSLDVPTEVLWEKWGATPQEITRWKALAAPLPAEPPTSPSDMTGTHDMAGTQPALT
ncbi:MAG: phage portal protein [Actinomycetes bacterium]